MIMPTATITATKVKDGKKQVKQIDNLAFMNNVTAQGRHM